ncbi:MAG: amylo-alpha-1,6-glucosidase [Candidatus Margulisiibacteriota bacterium]
MNQLINDETKKELIKNHRNDDLINAYNICKKILKNAYNKSGINAGKTHFSDVWIRDSSFASLGALSLKDTEIVKNFLSSVIINMKSDGQCPLRIGQKYFLLKYIHLKGPTGPTFIEDKYISIPVDSNALFIIVSHQYITQTRDTMFLKTNYEALIKAIDWYKTVEKNGLVYEGPYAGWADSVKKQGHVLYTNVLYCHALKCISDMAKILDISQDEIDYTNRWNHVKEKVNTKFWNGNFLVDWIKDNKKKDILSIDGNALAILFNIVDLSKQNKILTQIVDQKMITNHGVKLINKSYQWTDIYPPFHIIGLKDYHNGLIWLWVSAITSIAFIKNNKITNGMKILDTMANVINQHETMYEIYDTNGNPIKRLFYKSEEDFAWSAGLFIWAYELIFSKTPR